MGLLGWPDDAEVAVKIGEALAVGQVIHGF